VIAIADQGSLTSPNCSTRVELRTYLYRILPMYDGNLRNGSPHLGPRQKKSIARKDLSAEIQTAEKAIRY
jgi:hypothetical protein